jgi:hypothetical protein
MPETFWSRFATKVKGVKGWFAGTTAVVAFLISITTAYYSLIPIDDLRVAMAVRPSFEIKEKEQELSVSSTSGTMTFINSGNRSVGIEFVGFGLSYQSSKCFIPDYNAKFAFNPVIVKPSDIVRSDVSIGPLLVYLNGIGLPHPEGQAWKSAEVQEMKACAMFDLITPDSEFVQKGLVLETLWSFKDPSLKSTDKNTVIGSTVNVFIKGEHTQRPQELIRRRWFWGS